MSEHIAFVCPRFAEGPTVGGAETLLRSLAVHAVAAGRKVTFLTTCARNHFTWANDLPAGARTVDGMEVIFFPVDADRDISAFLDVQATISREITVGPSEEMVWIRNNVNSKALCDYLGEHGDDFDRIVTGPYLFGLVYFAALIHPTKTILVPCLHDEPFAKLKVFDELFHRVHCLMFNSVPERDLACRLYGLDGVGTSVVGMGLDPFEVDVTAFARQHELSVPYVIYCGRREPLKGTPLLMDYVTAFRDRTGRDVKLVLTGTGEIDPPLELAAHVIDVGFVSEKEKHDAMAGALAFCHPSVNESFGIVVMESWLAGTPALVHGRSAVLRHQCERSNGGLWYKSYAEFEEELVLLMDRRDVRDALGNAGREYVTKEYSWKNIDRKLLETLDM